MKKKSFATLKRKLDKLFSEWIRRKVGRDVVTCITCGAVHHWKEIQCGHFISRIYLATRWNEQNAHPQCYSCNVLRRGNYGEYSLFMLKMYGQAIIEELIALKRRPVKLSRSDLEEMIQTYQAKLGGLP